MFRRRISERGKIQVLWNAIGFLVGCCLYAVGLWLRSDTAAGSIVKDLGQTITGAAIVFFLFDWITQQHTADTMKSTIREYLDTAFQKLTTDFSRSSLHDYRWDCHLSLPCAGDPYPEYLYQAITISCTVDELPDQLLFVIGQSDDDNALVEYFDDPRCFLRWPMSTLHGELDLDNERACQLGPLLINGKKIDIPHKRAIKTAGGIALEWRVDIAPLLQGRRANITHSFMVRKIGSTFENVNVITRLYRNCDDAEFRLVASTSLGVAKIFCYTTEVTPLITNTGYQVVAAIPTFGLGPGGSCAIFRQPLQRGSNIRFELRRKPHAVQPSG